MVTQGRFLGDPDLLVKGLRFWYGPFDGDGRGAMICRDTDEPSIINWREVVFQSALRSQPKQEYTISAFEKRQRLIEEGRTLLGGMSCKALIDDLRVQAMLGTPQPSVLRGITNILFLGQPFIGERGRRVYLKISYAQLSSDKNNLGWIVEAVWEMDAFNGDCWVVATLDPRHFN